MIDFFLLFNKDYFLNTILKDKQHHFQTLSVIKYARMAVTSDK